ncbi:MAG: 30S ribosomal protein S16 [Anaerovoracaceae bacterium]
MAVKIRLKRMGANKKPFYRVVVADGRAPRDGRFIEEIGYYNPLKEPAEIKIDAEKAEKWLANGAQPTDTVKRLFGRAGIAKPAAVKEQAEAVEAEEVKEPAQPTE